MSSSSPHPFQSLIPDILSILFQYFTLTVSQHDIDHILSNPHDHIFCENHILCWEFASAETNVKEVLRRTRGVKRALIHVKAQNNTTLDNETFEYFRGIRSLDICATTSPFTSEAFENLRGIHTLRMDGVYQVNNVAMKNLRGIHTLSMANVRQITDEAFRNFRGVKDLRIANCEQLSVAALEQVRGLETLDLWCCRQFDDEDFVHLRSVRHLTLEFCDQITSKAFRHLRNLRTLNMNVCTHIDDSAFENLRHLTDLRIRRCIGLTDRAFDNLRKLRRLDMVGCNQDTLTDAALHNLVGIEYIIINHCTQFTDEGVKYLHGVRHCQMEGCTKVTKRVLKYFSGVDFLSVVNTNIRIEKSDVENVKCWLKDCHSLFVSERFAPSAVLGELMLHFDRDGGRLFMVV